MRAYSFYTSILRPTIFLWSPEASHRIATSVFKHSLVWKPFSRHFQVRDERLEVSTGGIKLPNPVGLAAGFDKNCEILKSLSIFGFGYLTLGTITIKPRKGNPKPRIWRGMGESLLNSMGLPNQGACRLRQRLSAIESKQKTGPLILSISGLSVEEFSDCYAELEQYADAIELNVSTPNTEGVRIFQEPKVFEQLIDKINVTGINKKPIWVKIPPYFNENERENVLELVNICMKKSVKAITAINTKQVKEPRASIGTAGLSGKAIFEDMLRIVDDIYTHTDGKISLNACGGIFSGLDAWRAIQAGAASVQLYTGLVYNGPGIAASINRQLLRLLTNTHYKSISEAVGTKL